MGELTPYLAGPPEYNPETVERSWMDRLKNIGAVAMFAFQQSPGNEAIRGFIGATIYESAGNPLLVAAGVGAATLAIEGATSLSIAAALKDEQGMVGKFKQMVRKRRAAEITDEVHKSSALSDTAIMLGVGAGALIVKRHIEEPERDFSDDVKTGAKATALVAGFSAFTAGLIGGGVKYASMIGLEEPAEIAVDVLADGRTYMGLLGAAIIISAAKKGWKKLRSEGSTSQETEANTSEKDTKDGNEGGQSHE